MIRQTQHAGHSLRGRPPNALRRRRRRFRLIDLVAAVAASGVATVAAHRLLWWAVVAAIAVWIGAMPLAGAHASAALRLRRQAVATIIVTAIMTGVVLGLVFILSGLLGFALVFAAVALILALVGRLILFAHNNRSPVGLLLILDRITVERIWPTLEQFLGTGYVVRAIVDPTQAQFDVQLRSVLAVRAVDEIVNGAGMDVPTLLPPKGISVVTLEELYEDLTGQCFRLEAQDIACLPGSIWRPVGERLIDLAVGLAYSIASCILIPISAVAAGPTVETHAWVGKDGRPIRTHTLPPAGHGATRLRRLLAWGPLRWAPTAPALLLGKLASVGPAPVDATTGDANTNASWRLRQSVRPGITGWAAINGFPPGPDSIPFDLYYVRNRSLGLDLGILLRSLAAPVLSWRALTPAKPLVRTGEVVIPGALTVTSSEELVSIVLPAYREAGRIAASLELLSSEMARLDVPFEVIVVSDGNTDGTELEARMAEGPITVIHYPQNRGKGYALRRGTAESRGARVVFIDADMELHPRGISRLLAMLDAGADVAIGSKRHPESQVHYPRLRRIQSEAYQLLIRRLFGLNVTDTQTGLKAFRAPLLRAALPALTNDGFSFDLELLVQLADAGAVIAEGPISLEYRFQSTTSLSATVDVLRETLRLWHRRRVSPVRVAKAIET